MDLDVDLDLDLGLDLDLNLGQWLSRPVRSKFQCGKDDILVMEFRGFILDEIWSWIWIWSSGSGLESDLKVIFGNFIGFHWFSYIFL